VRWETLVRAARLVALVALVDPGQGAAAATPGGEAAPTASPRAAPASLPASCARPVIRPTRRSGGWHRVQYELEQVYCHEPTGKMFAAILAPGARQVTENHYAGALFTALYAGGDAAPATSWLRDQLEGDFQGGEQGGGYTNYYRADVLAALRWAEERVAVDLAELARQWLRRSYALDLLHTVPGSYEVAQPGSRHKLYNRDGREMSLRLLAGAADPPEVLAARRWQYPAYDDVRWLADALLAGRLRVDPDAAAWAERRERAALDRILAELRGLELRSPLRWVLLDSGGWYSYAPEGIDALYRPLDAVAVTAAGEVRELLRRSRAARGSIREQDGRLVTANPNAAPPLALPPGRPVLTIEIGRGDGAGRAR
jgi:hypothetical protein